MITETGKVIALAAMIVAAGVTTVELTRDSAQADPRIVAGGSAGYAGKRVDTAFEIVGSVAAPAQLAAAVAQKGDLQPIGCETVQAGNAGPECTNVAYNVSWAEPATVVETQRGESSSVLMRLSRITVAGF